MAATTKKIIVSKENDLLDVFIYGNTVLKPKVQTEPQKFTLVQTKEEKPEEKKDKKASVKKYASSINMGYTIFLTLAAFFTVFICINYINLKTNYISIQKTNVKLESNLNNLRLDNGIKYETVMASIDMQKVRKIAMEDYGMTYPMEDQIVYYTPVESDYVKQYIDIPTEGVG